MVLRMFVCFVLHQNVGMAMLPGHSSIVELLLERGADYASTDGNGALALHYAAQNDYAVGNLKICTMIENFR